MDINAKINKRNAERLLDELMDECKRIGYEHAEDELKSLRAEVETLRRELGVANRELAMLRPLMPSMEQANLMEVAKNEIETLRRERIKGLEAERDGWREDANISRNSIAMLKDRCNYLEGTLDDLRQRIDDAPVVAWLHTQSNGCSSLIRTPPSAFDPQDLADAEVSIYALISKEDLQK